MRVLSQFSAYIPCFNNLETVFWAADSLRQQTIPPSQLFAVDDGSSDDSARKLRAHSIEVVQLGRNYGRGASRARAMKHAQHEFVLSCDATNVLPPEFAAAGLRWFSDEKVAAVYGCLTQKSEGTAVHRWRGRHLFRMRDGCLETRHNSLLATYGAIVRRSAVMSVGNYDARLRHSEDADLGERLLAAGWDVVMDPSLKVNSIARNSLGQVLERYWRWYAGKGETASVHQYARNTWYSLRVMVRADLQDRDPAAALISILAPHYQFWRSFLGKLRRQRASKSAPVF